MYSIEILIGIMFVMSVLTVLSSWKRLKKSLEQSKDDLKVAVKSAKGFGKYAVVIFTVITGIIMGGYIYFAGYLGLFSMAIVYALIIFRCIALMIEYGALQHVWGYGKKSFAFDKVQCWINIATAMAVVLRVFMTGLVRF